MRPVLALFAAAAHQDLTSTNTRFGFGRLYTVLTNMDYAMIDPGRDMLDLENPLSVRYEYRLKMLKMKKLCEKNSKMNKSLNKTLILN